MREDWIETHIGVKFHLSEPRLGDIYIDDIAWALSYTCRFGGHCRRFYSVAQHSVLVARACPPELRLQGLLHDAAEAYLGDVTSPLKCLLPAYAGLEERLMKLIAKRFGLPWPFDDEVKRIDMGLLATEKRELLGGFEWPPDVLSEPALDCCVGQWVPDTARVEFLRLFEGQPLRRDL